MAERLRKALQSLRPQSVHGSASFSLGCCLHSSKVKLSKMFPDVDSTCDRCRLSLNPRVVLNCPLTGAQSSKRCPMFLMVIQSDPVIWSHWNWICHFGSTKIIRQAGLSGCRRCCNIFKLEKLRRTIPVTCYQCQCRLWYLWPNLESIYWGSQISYLVSNEVSLIYESFCVSLCFCSTSLCLLL